MNQDGMKPLPVNRAGRATLLAGLGLVGVMVADQPIRAAGHPEPLLRPTPLVLKDGRIANVSIHEVPFAHGQASLSREAGAELSELTRTVATDCFLTAQVIGHIASSEIAEQESLSAHRLARARADAVQASLIDGGLPAKAIASVWDWQFMVREARATLWVFQLTAGEDCEGRPLREALVAQAPSSRGQPATESRDPAAAMSLPEPARPQDATPAPRRASADATAPRSDSEGAREAPGQAIVAAMAPAKPTPQPGAVKAQGSGGTPEPLARAAIAAARSAEPSSAGAPAETSRTGGEEAAPASSAGRPAPAVTATPPATEPKATAAPARQQVAATRERATTAARPPQPAGTDGKVETGPDGALVITFATNSSYMPSGTSRRLQQLLAGLEPGKRYEASLQVAVSGSRKVVGAGSAEEALRYNRWLAERRLQRVEEWLLENASPDTLSIRPSYLAGDESRAVTVRLTPVG